MSIAALMDFAARRPRTVFLGLALWCVALLLFGLYLQHVQGLEPCPMCIVQRYALMGVAVLALALAAGQGWRWHRWGSVAVVLVAGFGAVTAARQSWLQWFPPEVFSCGRGFYGMIESFPMRRAIPMIFRGSGDCTQTDWTFLGLSIPNWSFLNFSAMVAGAIVLWLALGRRRPA